MRQYAKGNKKYKNEIEMKEITLHVAPLQVQEPCIINYAGGAQRRRRRAFEDIDHDSTQVPGWNKIFMGQNKLLWSLKQMVRKTKA